jgi:hypothetical protein
LLFRPYSPRNATIGSTFDARHAGTQHAASAVSPSSSVAAASVAASVKGSCRTSARRASDHASRSRTTIEIAAESRPQLAFSRSSSRRPSRVSE